MPPFTPEPTQQPPTIEAPTRDVVLAQLDAEVAAYRADEQAGGWTPWAVSGALLAVAALLVGTWERGGTDPTRVAFWCLACSLVADALLAWLVPTARPVVDSLHDARGIVRAWPGSFYRPRRPVYAAACARFVVLAIACFATGAALDRIEPGLVFIAPAVTYLMRAAQLALWFKEAGSDALIPDWTGRREGLAFFGSLQHRSYVPALLFTALAAAAVWAYVHGAGGLPRAGVPLGADVRAGALVAAGALLALWLVDLTHRPPVTPRLLEIRRRLALGRVDAGTAARELEEITAGVEHGPAAERAALKGSLAPFTPDARELAPVPADANTERPCGDAASTSVRGPTTGHSA